jgi:hypothetical protein
MAVIIQLAEKRSPSRPPVKDEAGPHEAEIVFFTGVRYERYEDTPKNGSLPKKGGGRRAGKN